MIETFRAVAHPWLCDANRHLTTRHYQGFFDDASLHLLAMCGVTVGGGSAGVMSVVDVKCVIEYRAEVGPGGLVVIRSGFRRLGGKSFAGVHEMSCALSGELHAVCEITSVFFDLDVRRSVPMPDEFRAAAQEMLVA